MCGIVGIHSPEAKKYIRSSINLIGHRGPDDEGYFFAGHLALAHKRLSIQDLSSSGHQPMQDESQRFVIIFNGEIYNHWDLRRELSYKYKFKSDSDTETLLYGYIEYGVDILNKLNGIFAFAIFDRKKNNLFIARDQFGVKPLYYYSDDKLFWFSSEIKSLLPLPFENNISEQSLANYLTFLWSPGTQTPFEFVHKLLPGHYLLFDINAPVSRITIKKYYEIPFNGCYSQKTEDELLEALETKLLKSVERQLLSDVPIGFFLSGGLDSSCILALAKKIQPDKKFNCYTIKTAHETGSEGFSNDLLFAQKVADCLDVNLIEVDVDINIVRDFDKMIYHLDEPQADAAPLNVYYICKRARLEGDIVLLGGTGGDDLFSGYRRHQALRMEGILYYIPRFLRGQIKRIAKFGNTNVPTFRRLHKLTEHIDLSTIERLIGYFYWMNKDTLFSLFSKTTQENLRKHKPGDIMKLSLSNIPLEKNLLNLMLYLDLKYFLTDHNLNYTDKMSMATGVEVRVPFLDKELLEFSTKIPPNLKLKGVTTKYLLKKLMEKYLPNEVIYRPKTGFGAPLRKWVTEDLDFIINDRLSRESVEKRGLFNFEKIRELIQLNKIGKIDASYNIWSLLAIESWMRQFYDQSNYSSDQRQKINPSTRNKR